MRQYTRLLDSVQRVMKSGRISGDVSTLLSSMQVDDIGDVVLSEDQLKTLVNSRYLYGQQQLLHLLFRKFIEGDEGSVTFLLTTKPSEAG